MEETIARQFIIEHLEQYYQKPYAETCLGGDFKLKFIPAEISGEKCKHRATWIAKFFEDLTGCETDFSPVSIEIYLDDETGEIWTPPDPFKKPTPQEKRFARKERRQARRNRDR